MAVSYKLEVRWDGANWTDETAYLLDWNTGIGMPAHKYITFISETGQAEFVLDNRSRRFSCSNASSPIYAYLKPGIQIRISAVRPSDSATTVLFFGFIRAITGEGRQYGSREIVLRCMDRVEGLKWQRCSVTYAASKVVSTAISEIAAQAYSGVAGSYDDNGDVIRDYGKRWFDADRHSVYSGLEAVCKSFFGYFGVARDGTFIYKSRWFTRNSDGIFSLDDSHYLNFVDERSYDLLVNHARVICYPPEQSGVLSVLWSKGSVPSVQPGTTRVFSLPFRDNVTKERIAAVNVLALVAGTDYIINSRSDGLGAVITSLVTVSTSIEARRLVLTVTNNTQYVAWFTTLQVRGYPLVTYDPVTLEIDNSAGSLRRLWEVDAVLLGDTDQAYGFCNHLLKRYAAPHFCKMVELKGGVDGDYNLYSSIGLFKNLSISESQSGLVASPHIVRRVEYEPEKIRLFLEPMPGLNYFELDHSGLDDAFRNDPIA